MIPSHGRPGLFFAAHVRYYLLNFHRGLGLILLAQCTGSPAITESCESCESCESDGACIPHNGTVVSERMGNKEGLCSTLSRVLQT